MKHNKYILAVILLMPIVLANGLSYADKENFERKYQVTITNLTLGQIFSAPIVISHKRSFRLFNFGEEATEGLAALAEDGNPVLLTDLFDTHHPEIHYAIAGGNVMPGDSVTVNITFGRYSRQLSVAGMLVTTNDAFFAVRNIWVPLTGEVVVEADAYDAGSERNSEDCDFIPGPPCGNPFKRDTEGAEGYVFVHAGIHGGEDGSDLTPAQHDWRNPFAQIKISRIY